MATLQQQRQAIAAGMAASRAPTGQTQRQAGGQAMIEQRTGQSVAADINRLTDPRPPRKTLRPVEPVGAFPPTRGRGVYKAPPATGTAGIASPLTEEPSTRVYYPDRLVASTDGAVFFSVRAVQTLTMRDANDAEVVLELTNAIA